MIGAQIHLVELFTSQGIMFSFCPVLVKQEHLSQFLVSGTTYSRRIGSYRKTVFGIRTITQSLVTQPIQIVDIPIVRVNA